MSNKFCNKCFQFAGNADFKFVIYDCAHVFCINCVNRKEPKICLICKEESQPKKLEQGYQHPKDAYKVYQASVRFMFTQQNMMCDYFYNRSTSESKKLKHQLKSYSKVYAEKSRENKEMSTKLEEMKSYINYYENFFKGSLSNEERFKRPKNPITDLNSTANDTFAFLK